MEISINTQSATKRELLLVAGLFTQLADVTEYARTTNPTFPPIAEAPAPVQAEVTAHVPSYGADVTPPAGATTNYAPAVALPGFIPPVPAATSLPTAEAPPADVPDVDGQIDSDGMPWDDRIHAGSRTKNADGRWRARKGLNDASLVARVRAERMGAPAPAPEAAHPAPPPAYIPGAAVPAVPGHMPTVPPVPAPPVPAAPAADTPLTFSDLCMKLATAGHPQETIQQALQQVGEPSLALLGAKAEKIPAFWAALTDLVD